MKTRSILLLGTLLLSLSLVLGQSTSSSSSTTTTTTTTTTTGWQAQYYSSASVTDNDYSYNKVFQTPVTTRTDSTLDYDFSNNWNVLPSQLASTKANFAVRWSGWLTPTVTDNYAFGVAGDDGYVLTLDNAVILNEWQPQTLTSWSTAQTLSAGSKYQVVLEYFQAQGGAQCTLYWKGSNGQQQVIPTDNVTPLTTTSAASQAATSKGWQANFYKSSTSNSDMSDTARFSDYTSDRLDSNVNYPSWVSHWSSQGAPGIQSTDHFAARWSGMITPPTTDKYTFTMKADDGVRVLVNGQPVITGQSWNQVQNVQSYTASCPFTAKTQYQVVVEYFQLQDDANAQLMWSSSQFPQSVVGNTFVTPVTSQTILKVIPFSGKRFATLDGTAYTTTTTGQQAQFQAIPPGWKIATDCPLTTVVSALGKWGTNGLVVQNGKVLKSGTTTTLQPASSTNIQSYNSDTDNTVVYRPNSGSTNRILIESDELSPGDVDQSVPTITKTVVFKGKRYAVHDGTHPTTKPTKSGSTGCNKFQKIPAGWTIAPKDSSSSVIMSGTRFQFGASSLVTSDSNSYSSTTGQQTGTNQITTVTTDQGTFNQPTSPDNKILITQPAPANQPDSWTTVITPTNTIRTVNGNTATFYATLDNAQPDSTTKTNQDVPYSLPNGWTLASPSSTLQTTITQKNIQFGTNCLILADGTGLSTTGGGSCGSNLLNTVQNNGVNYYTPNDASLPSRILIQNQVPLDQLPANGQCGQCQFWGDPHVTAFNGASWTFALSQTAQYTFLKPQSNLPQNYKIWTQDTAFGGVDTETDVFIQYEDEVVQFHCNQAAPEGYSVTRNGQTIDPNNDNNPTAQIVITPDSGAANAGSSEYASFSVSLPNGIILHVNPTWWSNINLWGCYLQLPNSLAQTTEGICGSCGSSNLIGADGSTYTASSSQSDLDNFGKSWQTSGGIPTNQIASPAPTISGLTSKRQAPVAVTAINPNATPRNVSVDAICSNRQVRKFSEWLCNGLTGARYTACQLDFCVSGSTAVSTSSEIAEAQAMNDINNNVTTCTPGVITNFVTFQDLDYAVLDNTPTGTDSNGGQTGYISIPAGWELAPDTALSRAFIASSSFGSTCLTLRHGLALSRDLKQCHSGFNLRMTPSGCYKPISQSRILLVRSVPNANFLPAASAVFTANGTSAIGWTPLGVGYTLSNQSVSGAGNSIRLTASNQQMAGATFTGTYSNDQRFTIGIWSASLMPLPWTYSTTSTIQMKIDLVYANKQTETAAVVLFSTQYTDFYYRSAEIVPTSQVSTVTITLSVQGFDQVDILFSNIYIFTQMFEAGNILVNPTLIGGWGWSNSVGSGFTYANNTDHTGIDKSGSILLDASKATYNDDYVALQNVKVPAAAQNVRGIYFSGWSLQKGMDGSPASGYSIFVNILYTDQSSTVGVIAPFENQVNGWQFAERSFKIADGKVIDTISFAVVLRRHVGIAYFDDLYLTLLTSTDSKSVDIGAAAVGLGHVVTLSGRILDLDYLGDFTLYQDSSLTVIGRSVKMGSSATVFGAVMIKYPTGNTIQIERNVGRQNPIVKINGAVKTLTPNNHVSFGPKGSVGSINLDGSLAQPPQGNRSLSFYLDFPATGHRVVVVATVGDTGKQWLQVFPKPPLAMLSQTSSGLMGKYDPSNSKSIVDGLNYVQGADYEPTQSDIMANAVQNDAGFDLDLAQNNISASDMWTHVTRRTPSHYPAKAQEACAGVALNAICLNDYMAINGDSGLGYSYGSLEQLVTAADPSDFVLNLNLANSDNNNLEVNKTAFIVGVAIVGAVILLAFVVLIVVIVKKRGPASGYQQVVYS